MCGPTGVPSTPTQLCVSGAGNRSRSRALSGTALTGLAILSTWWLPLTTAQAASYPPALGCAVSGTAAAGSSVLTVHGMGFRAGSRVSVSVAGHRAGRAVADSAGSFQAAWPVVAVTPESTLRATGPGCSATGRLVVETQRPLPPSEPTITAIPVARLTGLPPQLFLGLAGAVLLAGAALTGLTGRLGHRAEGRSSGGTAVAGLVPAPGRQHPSDLPEQQ